MIKFEVLRKVTAWDGAWKAHLRRQQQLILAALVFEKGRHVPRSRLAEALGWDEKESQDQGRSTGRLKGVVHELRIALSPALPDMALRSVGDRTYELALKPEQADVLRFREGVLNARQAGGDDRVRLFRAALAEWGAEAGGLYGGEPLLGLDSTWAKSRRDELRKEYRDAVMECVKRDLDSGRHREVMQECDQLATGTGELGDFEFVEAWVTATFRSGQWKPALDIVHRADEYAENHSIEGARAQLRELVDMIKNKDPRLGPSDRLLTVLPATVPEAPSAPAAPADDLPRSESDEPVKDDPESNERTSVSEPSITFNIGGTASVGSAIARNDGHVTISMGAAAVPVVGDVDDSGPDDEDREDS